MSKKHGVLNTALTHTLFVLKHDVVDYAAVSMLRYGGN